jgi:ketosteroid isomerase-like protein
MKTIFLFTMFLTSLKGVAQSGDEKAIRLLLDQQTDAWNRGDIEGFMNSYWESDSLMFLGKSGVTYGWANTLKNYRKGYPDTAVMGKLSFDYIKIKRLSKKYYFVVGKWHLKRSIGDIDGYYNLLFEKINGRWAIVVDHSS